MTYYASEIQRISESIYSNQQQLSKVIGIKKYIDQHYDSELNLDHLSKTQFVSKYHLLRLFKKYYGQTPKQYTIDKRIKTAKSLLKTGISVSETCFTVGFESPGSFSALFKNKIGKSPSEFQKEQLLRSEFDSDQ